VKRLIGRYLFHRYFFLIGWEDFNKETAYRAGNLKMFFILILWVLYGHTPRNTYYKLKKFFSQLQVFFILFFLRFVLKLPCSVGLVGEGIIFDVCLN